MNDYVFWSARRLADAIQAGELSAIEACDACIERIEQFDGDLNAVCVKLFDQARETARAADAARVAGQSWGPLHGVPVTVKEAYDVAGTPTTWGLSERRDHVATEDADGVRRLREAGAVILGKTNVPPNLMDWQTDNPVYGRTNNPWDRGRTPGGSSGGSAVAMAVGYAYLEAGSDIGGSVRNPAHFCGIAAHKPSFGVVADTGHRLNEPDEPIDLLVCGPMARYAEDLALAMDVLAGPEPREAPAWRLELPPPRHGRLSDYRIAVIDEEPVCPISGAVKEAIAQIADVCEQAGATVERGVALPFDSRSAHRTYLTLLRGALAGAITTAQFDEELELANQAREDDSSYRTLIARAFVQRHRDWLIADAARLSLRKAWNRFFTGYDALLCPIAPTPAWPHDPRDRYDRTIDVDGTDIGYFDQIHWAGVPILSYLPATTIPAQRSREGLPIGVQIVADYLQDHTALGLARLIEAETGGFTPPPAYAIR